MLNNSFLQTNAYILISINAQSFAGEFKTIILQERAFPTHPMSHFI